MHTTISTCVLIHQDTIVLCSVIIKRKTRPVLNTGIFHSLLFHYFYTCITWNLEVYSLSQRTVQVSLLLGRSREVSKIYSNVDFLEVLCTDETLFYDMIFSSCYGLFKKKFFLRKIRKTPGCFIIISNSYFVFNYSLHCAGEPVHYYHGRGDAVSTHLPYPGGLAQTQVRCSPLYSQSTQTTLLYPGILSHLLVIISTKHYMYCMYMYMS